MKTGLLGGFLTGTTLSALALGAASVATYVPQSAPDAAEVDVPAGSEFRQSREDEQANLPDADETPDPAAKPRIEPPAPDELASLDEATTTAAQPSTGTAETGLVSPDAPDEPVGLDLDVEEPVLPSPQALAPQTPESEEDLSISTQPAQPVQPEIEESNAFEDEAAAEEPAAPAGDTVVEPEVTTQTAPEVQTEITEPAPAPDVSPEVVPEITTQTEVQPETENASQPEAASDSDELSEPVSVEVAQAQQEVTGKIGNIADGVTVGRLPSVSATEDAEITEEATEEEEPEATPQIDDAQIPLVQYAAPFENPEGKPILSFVLLDEGDSPVSFEALAEFPYPISYAVDVTWSGAGAAMERYRAAGLEVLAMIDLPAGADAVDTEVSMQTYLAALPETVAVMEGLRAGLQSSREATEQLIPILKESGHGLVLFSEGLDTAQKLIAREGVPALSVFRDIDGNDQSASVIRRFLDQAAFRAGQEETGVIIVGRLRAETVSALLLWGLQDRANSVAIAPVSALLQSQLPE